MSIILQDEISEMEIGGYKYSFVKDKIYWATTFEDVEWKLLIKTSSISGHPQVSINQYAKIRINFDNIEMPKGKEG